MAIQLTCDVCQAEYNLKDDLAGKKLRCKRCESMLVVPEAEYLLSDAEVERAEHGYQHDAFDRDRFLVNQKRISISEKYFVFDENKQPILFVERPACLRQTLLAVLAMAAFLIVTFGLVGVLVSTVPGPMSGVLGVLGAIAALVGAVAVAIWLWPLRHVTIYSDPSKQEPLVEIFQRDKINFINATYLVQTPDGTPLGTCIKNYLYDLFRKRWYVNDPDGNPLLLVQEDSIILSLLRRFLGPFFGLLMTNFVFQPAGSDEVIGQFNRKFSLFDRYVLDLSDDPGHLVDRRLGVALAVLLDTGERR